MNTSIRKPAVFWGCVWVAAIFLLALRPIEDFDTFWQLQSGKYIWQTKSFITTDLFSLAKDAFRLEHCWLSDVVFYALHSLGGEPLLNLLKPLTLSTCALLFWIWSQRRGVAPALALPVLTLCLLASQPSWLIRPQLWTFILSILFLWLLYAGREDKGKSWFWLAPLMLLWANLHAACVFGFALIGFFGVGEVVRALRQEITWRQIGTLALAGFATLAAAFFNPYGYRIPLVFLGNIKLHDVDSVALAGNMEWLPPTFAQVPLFYIVMALWGLLLLLRWRRLDPAEPVFFGAFLYMGLSMIRHATLVGLLAGFFLPGALQAVVEPYWAQWRGQRLATTLLQWGTAAVLCYLVITHGLSGEMRLGLKAHQYPEVATDFVRANRLPPNLYNAYDWGGYLMWRLYPDYLVFVDGRQDSIELFNASNVVDNAENGWADVLDRYQVNSLLVRTCYYDTGEPLNLVSALSRHPGWALVYRDDVALVYVRRSAATATLLSLELPPTEAFRTMLAEASRLFAEDPDRKMALLGMGRAALRLGQINAARDSYGRYLIFDPANQEAAMALRLLPQH